MLTTKIDTFNITRHSKCLGERKNWDSVPCFVPTAAARTIFSSKLWETISPIRFSRYLNSIIFRTKSSLCPNHQAFLFCSCKYYVWFEKRTNKGYLPLQNFRMKQAQQVLSMIFFISDGINAILFYSAGVLTKLKFFVIQSAPAYCLNASCQHWSHFSDNI